MRAESRGLAGRNAMLAAGRSKSKRSVRMLMGSMIECASYHRPVVNQAVRALAVIGRR
jgi:hypothetical protein